MNDLPIKLAPPSRRTLARQFMRCGWGLPLAAILGSCSSLSAETLPGGEPLVEWLKPSHKAELSEVSGVDIASDGRIFVLHRAGRVWKGRIARTPIAEPTVLVFSPDGKLLNSWGAGIFLMPHGISIDSEDKVWITDVGREQVIRFSNDGHEELVLGEYGVGGEDHDHFGRPTDVAFIGERVLVADGYVNTRIIEFDRKGQFLRSWGKFKIAHAVAVDERRIYVADRENACIQIYSLNGEHLGTWASPTRAHTYSLKPLGNGRLLAVEGRDGAGKKTATVRVYAADGTIEHSMDISLPGRNASLGHDIAIDRNGFGYVADVPGIRVVRFEIPPAVVN